MTVKCLAGVEAMDPVLPAWQAAAERVDARLPYCGPAFVVAMLRAYHSDDAPVLVHLAREGRAEGVLPLIERPLKRLGQTIRESGFPFNPNAIINDPLIRPDAAGAHVATLAELLSAAFGSGAETLILDHLPDPLAASFAEAAERIGARADPPLPARSLYYTRFDGGWEEFLGSRSRNHRWQIRKALKALGASSDVTIDRLSSRADIAAALPDWFAVEAASWQGGDPASAMTDRDRAFHALLVETLPPGQLGDLWIVRFSGRPVAALRMLGADRQVSVHTMHFDAAERGRAPGLMAFVTMMRAACDEGLDEVDMHGNTDFFARWATGSRAHQSIRIYRPGFRGVALQKCRRAIRGWRLAKGR